jgi:hypothetical protein
MKAYDLPEWQCYKVVRAARIIKIERTGVNYETTPGGDSGWRWTLDNGRVVVVSNALADRDAPRRPVEGDFYVVYDPDGYESWSPAAVFIAGYTKGRYDPWKWMRQWLEAYGAAHPGEEQTGGFVYTPFDAEKIMEWIQNQPMTEYQS